LVGKSAIRLRSEERRQPLNDPHFLLLEVKRHTVDPFLRDLARLAPAGIVETALQGPDDSLAEASSQGADDGVFLGEQSGHVAGAAVRDQRKKSGFLEAEMLLDLLVDGGDGLFEQLPVVGIGGIDRSLARSTRRPAVQRVHQGQGSNVLFMQHPTQRDEIRHRPVSPLFAPPQQALVTMTASSCRAPARG
jgi:hypothetical protein